MIALSLISMSLKASSAQRLGGLLCHGMCASGTAELFLQDAFANSDYRYVGKKISFVPPLPDIGKFII